MERHFAVMLAGIVGLTAAPVAAADCALLDPFVWEYRLERGSTRVGTGRISLQPMDRPAHCYELHQAARPVWALRSFVGIAQQTSRFCATDEGLRSWTFEQFRDGLGAANENYRLEFDAARGRVRGGRFGELEASPAFSDELQLQLRVRRWLCEQRAAGKGSADLPLATTIDLVDRNGPRRYTFAWNGIETLEVPGGRFTTWVIDRLAEDDRVNRFWVAPEADFLLVQALGRRGNESPNRLIFTGFALP